MTIRRMRTACWIPEATNIYWECEVLIAFPLRHWFHERASMLSSMYIACLVMDLLLRSNIIQIQREVS